MAKISNHEKKSGSLKDVIKGTDVFIGLSAPGMLTADMVKSNGKRTNNICHGKSDSGDHA